MFLLQGKECGEPKQRPLSTLGDLPVRTAIQSKQTKKSSASKQCYQWILTSLISLCGSLNLSSSSKATWAWWQQSYFLFFLLAKVVSSLMVSVSFPDFIPGQRQTLADTGAGMWASQAQTPGLPLCGHSRLPKVCQNASIDTEALSSYLCVLRFWNF